MHRDEHILELVRILKERYGSTLPELIEAYTESATVPSTIFSGDLTPLESIVQYMVEHRGQDISEAARLLGRRVSVAKAALDNAKKKGVRVPVDEEDPRRISVRIFRDSGLSPAEALVHSLKTQYQLTNAEIARTIGKDPRNIATLLRRAEKKGGGRP